MRKNNQTKTVFVLEGGAIRGLYSAGVLDVLMENNISTDTIYGVSAANSPSNPICQVCASFNLSLFFIPFNTGQVVICVFEFFECNM